MVRGVGPGVSRRRAARSSIPISRKQQLELILRERYLHPNGQIPAYEWNFGDVNPPVHAWAAIFIYRIEQRSTGAAT